MYLSSTAPNGFNCAHLDKSMTFGLRYMGFQILVQSAVQSAISGQDVEIGLLRLRCWNKEINPLCPTLDHAMAVT